MAAMMYGEWAGWGWMMLMPLAWIALIGVIVWAVVMVVQRGYRATVPLRETPQEILDRRLASGEIDPDAYTQARAVLAGRQRSS
jgi:putative membrane protein